MGLKKLWNLLNMYDLMIIALLVITAYNLSALGLSNITSIVSIVISCIVIDLVINYVKEKHKADIHATHIARFFSKSALITGLILSIILQGAVWLLIVVSAIAILSKHIIRIKGKHIFNPAIFGLFVALFLPVSQSWWGASNLLLLLVLGLVVVHKLKRFHLVLPFLAVQAALMAVLLSFDLSQLIDYFLSGSLIFFTFYMLIEPITSPLKMKSQIVFGVLAGVFASVLYIFWLPAMLVGSLFFADLCVPLLNRRPSVKPKADQDADSMQLTNPNW